MRLTKGFDPHYGFSAWAASALMLLSTAHGSNLAAHSLIFCVVVGHEIWPQLPPLVRKDVRKANPMLGDTLCHILEFCSSFFLAERSPLC